MVIVIQKIVYCDQGHEGRDTLQRAKTCAMITVAERRLGFQWKFSSTLGSLVSLCIGVVKNS